MRSWKQAKTRLRRKVMNYINLRSHHLSIYYISVMKLAGIFKYPASADRLEYRIIKKTFVLYW